MTPSGIRTLRFISEYLTPAYITNVKFIFHNIYLIFIYFFLIIKLTNELVK